MTRPTESDGAFHPAVPLLTLREKAELASGASFWQTRAFEHASVDETTLTDGPHGVRRQRAETDHLGLANSEPATCFPSAAATGSSWDVDLLEELGAALAVEAREQDVDVLLGPGINIKRSPLCGRNFEYFSEDPVLSGKLGSAWVRGLQANGVGASLKHFAANNQETDRMRVSAEIDERTLRELYLPAFERTIIDAKPTSVMCSYNRINGTYASQNSWLLTDLLRTEWGFEGYVVSDWGAVSDPVEALRAGLDLEMPTTEERSPDAIEAAVLAGRIEEDVLNRAISRVLRAHDDVRAGRSPDDPENDFAAHHDLARRIAAESSVLLKNDQEILPLDSASGGPIAVLGAFASQPRFQGAGSSHIVPTRLDNALTALQNATSRDVVFEPGFLLDGSEDAELLNAAVEAARNSDVAIVFLGLPEDAESEGFDREHILLPQNQRDLIEALSTTGTDTVVVLSNGSVVSLEGVRQNATAIVEMWLSGQAGGSAAADIIFGTREPSGRLAETVPLALEHTPAYATWPGENGVSHYGEGRAVGYRWYDLTDREVAYPFGFGLSYTTFEFSDITVALQDPDAATVSVSARVTNTGERHGSEVVQVYVGDLASPGVRFPHELRDFAKVSLAPGESRIVDFTLASRAFATWRGDGWAIEPGDYLVSVARHSRGIESEAVVTLTGTPRVPVLNELSTLGEWLAHPTGRGAVLELLADSVRIPQASEDAVEFGMVAPIPLRTLLSFASDEPNAILTRLLAHVAEHTP